MSKTSKQLPISKAKDGLAMFSVCERYLPLMGFEDKSILKKDLFVVPNREAFFQVNIFYWVVQCDQYNCIHAINFEFWILIYFRLCISFLEYLTGIEDPQIFGTVIRFLIKRPNLSSVKRHFLGTQVNFRN